MANHQDDQDLEYFDVNDLNDDTAEDSDGFESIGPDETYDDSDGYFGDSVPQRAPRRRKSSNLQQCSS